MEPQSLDELLQEIRSCRLCEANLAHGPRPVLHVSTSARLCIVGQAPGLRVHETGLSFNDASGDRLRGWLGVDRAKFYDESRIAIAAMAFCFPGYNSQGHDLPPRRECAATWRERLFAALPQFETTLLVGSHAQAWHLRGRGKRTMTETVEAWREYAPRYIPLPHPSWRNRLAEKESMVRGRTFVLPAAARAAVVAGLIAVAACAPALSPQGIQVAMPSIAQDAFLTRDGFHVPLRHWDAEHPRAVIVALHGMSDYSEAFDLPGPWWAAHGITTFAYDQRGFGRSPNAGLWGGADPMREDLTDMVEAVRAKYHGVPVYALGESMGGSVVLTALASKRPPRVDGAILVSPAVWSRADMPLSYRAALWIAARFVPGMHVSGSGLHIVACDNIEVLRKLSRDPVYQHSVRADQVYGLVNLMDEARQAPAHLVHPPPILFLYGGNDQVIPKAPTQAVVAALGPRADVRFYPRGYHMLLRDLDGETAWSDIAHWTGQ